MRQRDPLVFLGMCWLGFVAVLALFAVCVPLPPESPRPIPTATVRVLPAIPTPFVFAAPPTVTPREMILAPTRAPLPPTLTFTPMPTRTTTPDAGTRAPVQRGGRDAPAG